MPHSKPSPRNSIDVGLPVAPSVDMSFTVGPW
jgi:hypothetical protein